VVVTAVEINEESCFYGKRREKMKVREKENGEKKITTNRAASV